jgi:tRNA threonylcarbamoyladenosine biosynthesis protein TsaE
MEDLFHNKRIFLNMSEARTANFVNYLSPLLKSGDALLLSGDVGSGKTFLARRIIQKRLVLAQVAVEDIPSPTFTIVQIYDSVLPSIFHVDLYRLSDPNEIIELGLDEALESSICLIEWPDRLGPYMPNRYISIDIQQSESNLDERIIIMETYGSGWEHIINKFLKKSKDNV